MLPGLEVYEAEICDTGLPFPARGLYTMPSFAVGESDPDVRYCPPDNISYTSLSCDLEATHSHGSREDQFPGPIKPQADIDRFILRRLDWRAQLDFARDSVDHSGEKVYTCLREVFARLR